MSFVLVALTLCVFCVGTAELLPSGVLPNLSSDLHVSIPTAGLLVTAYALAVVVGGPVMTSLTTKLPRKILLIGLMCLFVIGNVIAALARSYDVLVFARVVTALCHGTFAACAIMVAVSTVPPEKAGSAIAKVALGLNLATVLGSPLGTLIGQHYGWRASFGLLAALAAIGVLMIARFVPRTDAATNSGSLTAEFRVFGDRDIQLVFLITVLASAGVFAVVTFLVPLLTTVSHFPSGVVSPLLFVFGIGSIVGNMLGGKLADIALMPSIAGLIGGLAATCLLLFAFSPMRILAVVCLFLFAVAAFSIIPGLQNRILGAASAGAPTLALTANISAFNLGNGIGAWYGGQVINSGVGVRAIPLSAAFLAVLSLIVAVLSWRRDRVIAARPAGKTAPTGETVASTEVSS